jgi:hypothetical protein
MFIAKCTAFLHCLKKFPTNVLEIKMKNSIDNGDETMGRTKIVTEVTNYGYLGGRDDLVKKNSSDKLLRLLTPENTVDFESSHSTSTAIAKVNKHRRNNNTPAITASRNLSFPLKLKRDYEFLDNEPRLQLENSHRMIETITSQRQLPLSRKSQLPKLPNSFLNFNTKIKIELPPNLGADKRKQSNKSRLPEIVRQRHLERIEMRNQPRHLMNEMQYYLKPQQLDQLNPFRSLNNPQQLVKTRQRHTMAVTKPSEDLIRAIERDFQQQQLRANQLNARLANRNSYYRRDNNQSALRIQCAPTWKTPRLPSLGNGEATFRKKHTEIVNLSNGINGQVNKILRSFPSIFLRRENNTLHRLAVANRDSSNEKIHAEFVFNDASTDSIDYGNGLRA